MSEQDAGAAFEPGEPGDPAAPTEGYHGPDGKVRELWKVIVLWLVTLGIYGIYWVYRQHKEIKDYAGFGVGGWIAVIFYILFAPIIWFLLPSEVGQLHREAEAPDSMTGWTGLWLLLPIVGWFVWIIKIQGSMNRFWAARYVIRQRGY